MHCSAIINNFQLNSSNYARAVGEKHRCQFLIALAFCKELDFLGENFVVRRSMYVAGTTFFSTCLHEGILYN